MDVDQTSIQSELDTEISLKFPPGFGRLLGKVLYGDSTRVFMG